jgi:ABC-type multidrug transport system fused ATPase/permease subunit
MSIKDNILYGNEDASNEKVREMAELANATMFIEKEDDDEEDLHNHDI